MPTADHPHVMDFTVRFADLDALGHLNNVAIITMVETGRVEHCDDLGLVAGVRPGFVLASLHVDYRAQGFYRDVLRLGTRVAHVGRTSFTLSQLLWRAADEVVVAEAESVLVLLGDDRTTPAPIPEALRQRMTGDTR